MEIFYTFLNTHTVILAENVLLSAGVPVKVRPVPSTISAGCGLCLCIPVDSRNQAETELIDHSAPFVAAYKPLNGGFERL
jgi:hypothetical protein